MRIYTSWGDQEGASGRDLEAALDALQRDGDEAAFVGVERDDGAFLQTRRLPLEHRAPGEEMPRRGSVPPGVRAMFLRFAEGKEGWDEGMEWLDVPAPRWWQALPWWALALPWVVVAALLVLLPRCSGVFR
jgi:hypothetical protein